MRSVLAERDFRLILVAWGTSMLGDFLVEFVAYASGGVLVELPGPRETFAVAGLGALAAGGLGVLRMRRV
jgi:hypothetical protein